MAAPTFEVLAFAARVATPTVAVLELEGRFSEPGRRGLGRPRLLVERDATQVACDPVPGPDATAPVAGGHWRAAFAVPLALVQDATFGLQIGRDLLVELPSPRLGDPDDDDGARLARLAREANDLRRRLDEAAVHAAAAEERAAATVIAAQEQAAAEVGAARAQAEATVAAAQEQAAAAMAAATAEVEAAREQSAAAAEAARVGAATEVDAARRQAAAEVEGMKEQAANDVAAAREQSAAAVAAAEERAAAAIVAGEAQAADALTTVDERIAAAAAGAEADLARVRAEAAQAADTHARALDALREQHAAQLRTTRLEAERLLDEALEVQRLRAAASQGELQQARNEIEFLRHGGLGAADAGSPPADPTPPGPTTAAARARESAPGEDETEVSAPQRGERAGAADAPTDVPDQPEDAGSRPRPWSASALPQPPITAETEIAQLDDGDATVRVVSGPRRPRHRAEDEEEPTRLSPGATRIGARSISPGTRTSRTRDPQRIGALVALTIAIAAFILVVVLRVGPI